jgi:hypothetical protein
LIALIIVLVIILAILFLRLMVYVSYYDGILTLKVGIQGLYMTLMPRKKPKKEKKEKKEKVPKPPHIAYEPEREKGKTDIPALLECIFDALSRLPKLFKGIHIVTLRADVVVSSPDAAKTAETYGKFCFILNTAYALLCRIFTVKDFSINLGPDFTSEKTTAQGEIKISTCIWAILSVAIPIGYGFLRYALKMKKLNDDGGKYERECKTAAE